MQGDNQYKLDDDILQCKADIQKALQGLQRANGSEPTEEPAQPAQSPQAAQAEPVFEKGDTAVSQSKPASDSPAGIRIPSFEAIQSKKGNSAPAVPPVPAMPPTDSVQETSVVEQLQQNVASLEHQLDALRSELAQTHSRLQETDAVNAELAGKKDRLAEALKTAQEAKDELENQLHALPDEHRRQMAVLESQLHSKTSEIETITRHNQTLTERLEASSQSAESQRLRIESMEHELAEKIAELASLKEQADRSAAALAEQVQQLRHAGQEKEAVEKRLEAQTAEWTKTINALKAAQKEAAVVLIRRQQELDTMHVELEQVREQLEQADADNTRLMHENAELTEALHDARFGVDDGSEAAMPAFDESEEDDAFSYTSESEPEPYCEPVGEVLSEDDVHLEQKLSDSEIPAFNLAEQIMAEQRKAAASRRQGPKAAGKTPAGSSIERVMRHYVSDDAAQTPPPQAAAEQPQPQSPCPVERAQRFLRWQGEILSAYQQSLLDDIIQNDIRRFCGPDIYASSAARPSRQPMDN